MSSETTWKVWPLGNAGGCLCVCSHCLRPRKTLCSFQEDGAGSLSRFLQNQLSARMIFVFFLFLCLRSSNSEKKVKFKKNRTEKKRDVECWFLELLFFFLFVFLIVSWGQISVGLFPERNERLDDYRWDFFHECTTMCPGNGQKLTFFCTGLDIEIQTFTTKQCRLL